MRLQRNSAVTVPRSLDSVAYSSSWSFLQCNCNPRFCWNVLAAAAVCSSVRTSVSAMRQFYGRAMSQFLPLSFQSSVDLTLLQFVNPAAKPSPCSCRHCYFNVVFSSTFQPFFSVLQKNRGPFFCHCQSRVVLSSAVLQVVGSAVQTSVSAVYRWTVLQFVSSSAGPSGPPGAFRMLLPLFLHCCVGIKRLGPQ